MLDKSFPPKEINEGDYIIVRRKEDYSVAVITQIREDYGEIQANVIASKDPSDLKDKEILFVTGSHSYYKISKTFNKDWIILLKLTALVSFDRDIMNLFSFYKNITSGKVFYLNSFNDRFSFLYYDKDVNKLIYIEGTNPSYRCEIELETEFDKSLNLYNPVTYEFIKENPDLYYPDRVRLDFPNATPHKCVSDFKKESFTTAESYKGSENKNEDKGGFSTLLGIAVGTYITQKALKNLLPAPQRKDELLQIKTKNKK